MDAQVSISFLFSVISVALRVSKCQIAKPLEDSEKDVMMRTTAGRLVWESQK